MMADVLQTILCELMDVFNVTFILREVIDITHRFPLDLAVHNVPFYAFTI